MNSTAQQGHEQANSRPCLVVTESQESSAKFLYVLKRWLPLHLAIRGVLRLDINSGQMLSPMVPSWPSAINAGPGSEHTTETTSYLCLHSAQTAIIIPGQGHVYA